MRTLLAPHRTQLGTGSKLKSDVHSQIFEGLENSEIKNLVKEKASKISALEAKLAQDLKTVDEDKELYEGGN